jgi:hypothetical protein
MNKRIFTGSDIDTGGIIIIPSPIKMLETIKSINRNGRNSTKPI